MNGEEKQFSSPQEEIQYWRELALEYKQSYGDAKEELDEFQASSRELEQELEAQLEQQEKKNRDLVSANSRLQMEVESLREKLENHQSSNHQVISELEDKLAQVTAFKDELQKYIRELEQVNDDLERAKRATVTSLEDFESRLNLALERNAFLESELEERDTMSVTIQRLKDEARDLRQELVVKDTNPVKSPTSLSMEKDEVDNNNSLNIDSNKLIESEIIAPSTPTNKSTHSAYSNSGSPFTASARISALNIVGDLLRKVGALESKLASCRNFVKDQPPRPLKSGSTSPVSSPRAKRLHRSATGPSGGPPPGSGPQQGYVKVSV